PSSTARRPPAWASASAHRWKCSVGADARNPCFAVDRWYKAYYATKRPDPVRQTCLRASGGLDVLLSRYLIVSSLLLLIGLSAPMSAQDKDKAKDATGDKATDKATEKSAPAAGDKVE